MRFVTNCLRDRAKLNVAARAEWFPASEFLIGEPVTNIADAIEDMLRFDLVGIYQVEAGDTCVGH